jgi:hypothetical protein
VLTFRTKFHRMSSAFGYEIQRRLIDVPRVSRFFIAHGSSYCYCDPSAFVDAVTCEKQLLYFHIVDLYIRL